MKHFIYVTAISCMALLVVKQPACAQPYRLAVGMRLSNASPTLSTSISGKYFVTATNAVEGLVSFGSRFGLGALLEFHHPLQAEGFTWYYGAGAFVGFQEGKTYLGPTGVLGIDYKFTDAPVNLSLDWKPELNFLPGVKIVPDAFALTVRLAFMNLRKQ